MITLCPAEGSLFNLGVQAITNPVNTKGVMGKGLAAEFKTRYPDMFTKYAALCRDGDIRVGEVWIWKNRQSPYPPTHIVNFPTKDDWRNPSKLEWIKAGLEDLKAKISILGIKMIGIPALGCGLGDLNFTNVHSLVQTTLDTPEVHIYLFPPR